MKVRLAKVCVAALLAVAGLFPGGLRAADAVNIDDIIQKAVARTQNESRSSPPDFQYTKLTVTEEMDGSGNLRERREKMYAIAYRGGNASVSLLRVNGHEPTADDRKKQTENETGLRQLLGGEKNPRSDQRDSFLTPELVARFQFKLVGVTNLNGRAAYRVSFAPKNPEPPVRRMVDRLLNRISGTLWIDTEEFELARADVVLRSEVSFLGGILGTLRKLDYTMIRTRVADGLWIGTLSSGDFEGRKLLDSMRIKTKTQSVDIRPVAMRAGNPRS